jgi:hypothetical protein
MRSLIVLCATLLFAATAVAGEPPDGKGLGIQTAQDATPSDLHPLPPKGAPNIDSGVVSFSTQQGRDTAPGQSDSEPDPL